MSALILTVIALSVAQPVVMATLRASSSGARATLLGIQPLPLPAVEAGDRPSEDELTCVVDRPAQMQLGTERTLASMPSVTAPRKKEGAS